MAERILILFLQLASRSLPLAASTLSSEQPVPVRLFDAVARAKTLTSRVAMHLDPETRRNLFQQLDSLHDPEEWDERDQPIQERSYATFLKAMLNIRVERLPGLGLSHSGNLIAAWTAGEDRLTIEFLPDDQVRWVLTRWNDGDLERLAGENSVSRLRDCAAQYGFQRWFGSH